VLDQGGIESRIIARVKTETGLAPSVGIGAKLQDSTDSRILVFVAEDLLDRCERVLTAAGAGRDLSTL
jgi:hypothetical protein